MYKHYLMSILRFLIVIIGVVAAYFMIKYFFIYLYPFVIAFMLTIVLNPMVSLLVNKLKLPRFIATLITMMLFISIFGSLIFFLIAEIMQGATYLAERIPATFEKSIVFFSHYLQTEIMPVYYKVLNIFNQLNENHRLTINETIEQLTSQMTHAGTQWLQHILLKIPIILSFLPQSLTIIIIILLATFLITNDWDHIKKMYNQVMPLSSNQTIKHIMFHLRTTFLLFVKAQMILVALSGFIIFISLIILKIEHALTISFIASLIDFLPYIGMGIIFIPWIIYLFFTGNYTLTISIIAVYMIIIILRQLLEPKIIATNIGIHPLFALCTLFLSFQLWGVGGLLITPLLLISAVALYKAGVIHQFWVFIKG